MSFEKNIQSWVSLDNQLRILNNKTRELREQRNSFSESIIKYVETNRLDNSVVEISDGQLRFANVNSQQSLTFKFLENALKELYPENEVKKIIEYIKSKRTVQQHMDIKRFSSN
tara:strand:+ start:1039 stop:1380 length:342 start_codon:yes stop_codon:yes gene_type:complete